MLGPKVGIVYAWSLKVRRSDPPNGWYLGPQLDLIEPHQRVELCPPGSASVREGTEGIQWWIESNSSGPKNDQCYGPIS